MSFQSIQALDELLHVIPGNAFHRIVAAFELCRIASHHLGPLLLSHLIFPQIKRLADKSFRAEHGFVKHIFSGFHQSRTGGNPDELHADAVGIGRQFARLRPFLGLADTRCADNGQGDAQRRHDSSHFTHNTLLYEVDPRNLDTGEGQRRGRGPALRCRPVTPGSSLPVFLRRPGREKSRQGSNQP